MDMQKLLPEGSTGKPAKSGGRCLICDQEKPKSQMVMRALYWDHEADEERGYKVCVQCSPHVSDLTVERDAIPYEEWPWRWKMNLDPNVFTYNGRTVTAEW